MLNQLLLVLVVLIARDEQVEVDHEQKFDLEGVDFCTESNKKINGVKREQDEVVTGDNRWALAWVWPYGYSHAVARLQLSIASTLRAIEKIQFNKTRFDVRSFNLQATRRPATCTYL